MSSGKGKYLILFQKKHTQHEHTLIKTLEFTIEETTTACALFYQ